MRVFVDTSALYALLDGTDSNHQKAAASFDRAQSEPWSLTTTNYVTHETWALVQARLGWEAVDAMLSVVMPLIEVTYVDEQLFALGAARCRQARERRLSITDCISFEFMAQLRIRKALAFDDHFERYAIDV